MRHAWRVGFVCLVVFLTYPACAAEVTWQVSAGFGGVVKEGAWTPVFVDISNEGESQAGRIVVPVTFRGRNERVVNYAVEVDLPRHSKKRYTIYLPNTRYDRVLLDLSHTRERKDAPDNLQIADPGDVLVVVIGGDPGFLSFLNAVKGLGLTPPDFDPSQPWQSGSIGEASARVGHLGWGELPESWIGWDGVDAVVVADAAFSGASQAGLTALRQWVQVGGTLIVPGGAQSTGMAAGPLADLLPAEIVGTTTLPDLAALGVWCERAIDSQSVLGARLSLRPGGRVLCSSERQPLIVAGNVGSGRVIFTAFDFTASPVKYWEGQHALWPKLLANRSERNLLAQWAEGEQYYWPGPEIGLTQLAATMPEAELPSLWLIVGFLVAYLLVLVPGNYWFLHRIDRRELAWVTTPAIVLVFTLGAYGIGYGMRGGTIVLNRIGIVETHAGAKVAHGRGYLGIFSPSRTTYELSLQETAAGARDLTLYDQHVRGRPMVYSWPQPKVAEVEMNMWTTRTFGVEYLADLGEGITGYLEYDGANFAGRVHNGSPLTLQDCRIVRGLQRSKGQEVKPGEEAEVAFLPSQASSMSQPKPYAGGKPKQKLEEAAAGALFAQQQKTLFSSQNGAMLVANVESLAVPATLRGKRPSIEDASLLVVHLPVRLARGRVMQVPPWLIQRRVVATTGSVTSNYDQYSGGDPLELEIERGSLTTEFTLPAEGGGLTAQQLALTTSSGQGLDPRVEVTAYDYRRNRWEVVRPTGINPVAGLPGVAGAGPGRGGPGRSANIQGAGGAGPGGHALTLPHPEDFLSADGRVQVRVAVPGGTAQVSPLMLNATVRTQ